MYGNRVPTYGLVVHEHSPEMAMNIRKLTTDETGKASHLKAAFAEDVNADGKHGVDRKQSASIARRYLDDVDFGLSLFMMLFLIASVLAIAVYTAR
jgi:hypothetical protein